MNEQVKYPRTPHLPHSPGMSNDDKMITPEGLAHLQSCEDFVVTEKMDGGNLTWTRNHFFGRSLDSGTHPWDQRARNWWAEKRFDIPEGWRVSGESLYTRRSVAYDNLPYIYMVFGIWNEHNTLLPWDEMTEWVDLMGLATVPVLYRGSDWDKAMDAWDHLGFNEDKSEGFVVRNANQFHYDDFSHNVAKYVRANHVRTRADWRHRDDFKLNSFIDNSPAQPKAS